MKAKGFLRKDIVEELSRFELARLTQPHLPDTQSPDSARAVEEAVFTDADRTDAERLRAFAGDVRMLAAQRQAMGATVEQFVDDLDLMATGKPCRIEDRVVIPPQTDRDRDRAARSAGVSCGVLKLEGHQYGA